MKKGAYEIIGFVFLSVFLLVFIANILGGWLTGEVVTGFQTDYGSCDFNISCGFDNWTSGNTYCLNESQVTTETCFNITSNDVFLNLQGFSITGDGADPISQNLGGGYTANGDYGIYVNGYDYVAFGNGNVSDFTVGVISSSISTNFSLMNIYDNSIGAYLDSCSDCFYEDLSLFSNDVGMFISNSSGEGGENIDSYENDREGLYMLNSDSITFRGSFFNDNLMTGVSLFSSNSNVFSDSTFNSNNFGFVLGSSNSSVFSNIVSSNNVNSGLSIWNSINNIFRDSSFSNNIGEGIVSDSSKNIFDNLILSGNGLNSTIGVESIVYNTSENKRIEWNFGTNFTLVGDLDFGSNILFGNNYVDVNSTGLPSNFNSTATITLDLSGTNITDPVPFADGVFCEDDVCNVLSFENNVTIFTVTHFTNYSFAESICGDNYCADVESCSICSADCGNCSVVNDSDDDEVEVEVNVSDDPVDDVPVSPAPTTADSNETDTSDDDEAMDIPWFWISIGIGVFVLGSIIFLVFLVIVKRGGGGVITVRRPPSVSSEVDSTTSSVASKPTYEKPAAVKPASPPVENVEAKKAPVVKPVVKSAPVVEKVAPRAAPVIRRVVQKSGALLPANIRYIKYYVQNVSHDPKIRIKYLMNSGKKFVEARDNVNAKHIYELIFEEYKDLDVHDEDLYVKIVAFRKSIIG